MSLEDDREIARRALDFQARAKDYSLIELPGYVEWATRKLREGESAALIANLDALGMTLLPEEVSEITEADFEELLSDLKDTIAESE